MLQPENLVPMVAALRPPAGHRLDIAVGTTFSLHLDALLVPPAAFALFEARAADHDDQHTPVALLDSVRRNAERLTVFCQSGQIAVPQRRILMPFLEESVVPVRSPSGLFHPKVWLLRFSNETGTKRYRLLCMSRNLTFDRSRDTIVRLDSVGEADAGETLEPGLSSLVRALPDLAVSPLDKPRRDSISELADEVRGVRFARPDGIESVTFLPLGIGAHNPWPFPDACDSRLVISPYLSADLVNRLPDARSRSVLVSNAETLDSEAPLIPGFDELFVMNSEALPEGEPIDDTRRPPGDPSVPEAGIHAKVFVFDTGHDTVFVTGSANATSAGFYQNTEALVAMVGRSEKIGVDALLGDESELDGLLKLLDPYIPVEPETPPTDSFDDLRRNFAAVQFEGIVDSLEDGRYSLTCRSLAPVPHISSDVVMRIWPLTSEAAAVQPTPDSAGGIEVEFTLHDVTEITSFLVLEMDEGEVKTQTVLTMTLVGDPGGRRGQLILRLLGDADRFMRYLLLLLADDRTDPFHLVDLVSRQAGNWREWRSGHSEIPLLESLLRALHEDPSRLEHVEALLADLDSAEARDKVLPPGFDDVWEPIQTVARELSR